MKIALANGGTVVDYPLIEQTVVNHLAERIVVDGGAIRIDSANHTLDESHLVLDGVLTAGQHYFKIKIRPNPVKLRSHGPTTLSSRPHSTCY